MKGIFKSLISVSWLLLICLFVPSIIARAESAGPFDDPAPIFDGLGISQHWNIPLHDGAIDKALFIHPNTSGPWKLVMMHHGIPGPKPSKYKDYPFISKFFLQRGYAVLLPVRQGSGATGGGRRDKEGSCNLVMAWPSVMARASEIEDIWTYVRTRSEVQKDGAIMMGKSQGGYSVLSAGKDNPEGIAGIIDLAGGVRMNTSSLCGEPELVAAIKQAAQSARLPTLLLYTANDHEVPVNYGKDMISAYTSGNPNAKGHMLSPVAGGDGHRQIERAPGVKAWGNIVDKFLESL
jgi:dienelactone hydrolase